MLTFHPVLPGLDSKAYGRGAPLQYLDRSVLRGSSA
jgi:hypothetical protein